MGDASRWDSWPWWRTSLRSQGIAVLAVPVAALFIALFFVYRGNGELRTADQTVLRALETRAELTRLHAAILNAETTKFTLLATGQPRFRALFDAARKAVGDSQTRLTADISDDPGAVAPLDDV